jgi:hypothetical protein
MAGNVISRPKKEKLEFEGLLSMEQEVEYLRHLDLEMDELIGYKEAN